MFTNFKKLVLKPGTVLHKYVNKVKHSVVKKANEVSVLLNFCIQVKNPNKKVLEF